MIKKCECLPKAEVIAREVRGNMPRTVDTIVEDGNFISAMLFVVQESGLVDTFDEFVNINKAMKEKDLHKFQKAVVSAVNKIEKAECE